MRYTTTTIVNRTQGDVEEVACLSCANKTRHEVVLSVDLLSESIDIQAQESYQIVKCLGCSIISFRLAKSNSEDFTPIDDKGGFAYDVHEETYPRRLLGRNKLEMLDLLPQEVEEVYDETHTAIVSGQRILAAIGIRTLVEAVCQEKQAKGKNLENKISSLVDLGVLTEPGAEILQSLRSMGNDATHDIRKHKPSTLNIAFEVAENLLTNVYILPEKAKGIGEKKRY